MRCYTVVLKFPASKITDIIVEFEESPWRDPVLTTDGAAFQEKATF